MTYLTKNVYDVIKQRSLFGFEERKKEVNYMDAKVFGKFIMERRKQLGMTQAELAEKINVTDKAVSRWETDAAMPDISLIAPLCNLFHVTADSLLEIDISRQQEEIWKICSEASKYSDRGYLSEARQILEDGLRRYPDSLDLAESLMFVSYWQHRASPTE